MAIVDLTREDAPKVGDPHRVLFTFTDDHGIDGMKVEIIGVTPEQIAVAIFYLQRTASQLADFRQMSAAQEAAQIAEMRNKLQGKRQ